MHYTTLYTTNTHSLTPWESGHFKATDVNWRVNVLSGMWIDVEIVCLGFL